MDYLINYLIHIVPKFPLPVFYHETSQQKYVEYTTQEVVFIGYMCTNLLLSLAQLHFSAAWTAAEARPAAINGTVCERYRLVTQFQFRELIQSYRIYSLHFDFLNFCTKVESFLHYSMKIFSDRRGTAHERELNIPDSVSVSDIIYILENL